MYRFLALTWNSNDPIQGALSQQLSRRLSAGAPDMVCVLDIPGVKVLHAPQLDGACHAYVLPRDNGVVLGKIFRASDIDGCTPSDPTFDDKESALLVSTKGKHLVDQYWGHYVALLRSSDGVRRFLVRDPSGGLPCYWTNTSGIDLFFSDMEDCLRLRLPTLSIDWEHLAAFMVHDRLITRSTGFNEVKQVYAGECFIINADTIDRAFHWNPIELCNRNQIENIDEAREILRGVVKHCTSAWASSYKSILHELSGGLDSSIVAACLAEASSSTDVLCFHHYTEMSEGDERPYARAAAAAAGFELIEREVRASERTLDRLLDRTKFATPALLGFVSESEEIKRRLTAERNAAVVFSGQGGDHLFVQARSNLIAAEYMHRHGLRPSLLGIVKDNGRLTKQSIWSIFGSVICHGLLQRTSDPYRVYYSSPSILTADVRASLLPSTFGHPWVANAGHLPAAKRHQVFYVVDCQPFYMHPRPYAEQVHPLISQPVIEACLQIPTYVLTHGGRTRGLIRDAFEDEVPSTIIRRRSKGSVTSYFNQILVENAAFLRDLLIDGALAAEGVLDRQQLSYLLSERELIRGKQLIPLITAIRAESWLRGSVEPGRRSAA